MTADATTMKCPHCQADAYYTPDMAGQVAECPDCQGDIQLPPAPNAEPRRKIILRSRTGHESRAQNQPQKTEMRQLLEAAEDIRAMMRVAIISSGIAAVIAVVYQYVFHILSM